jgi:hypothetical protein
MHNGVTPFFKLPILGEIPKALLIKFNERLLELLENTVLPEKKIVLVCGIRYLRKGSE